MADDSIAVLSPKRPIALLQFVHKIPLTLPVSWQWSIGMR